MKQSDNAPAHSTKVVNIMGHSLAKQFYKTFKDIQIEMVSKKCLNAIFKTKRKFWVN